jgi:hypothetical protein
MDRLLFKGECFRATNRSGAEDHILAAVSEWNAGRASGILRLDSSLTGSSPQEVRKKAGRVRIAASLSSGIGSWLGSTDLSLGWHSPVGWRMLNP